jgi:hypothetical protein
VVLPVTLKKRAKFVEISRYGLRAKTEVLISICQRDLGPYARVGYTASKKIGNNSSETVVKMSASDDAYACIPKSIRDLVDGVVLL